MDRDIERLVQENNELLHKLYRSQVRGRILRTLYWVAIIILALVAFYFIQPYVEQVQGVYTDVRDTAEQVKSIEESSGGLSDLLDFF